MTARISSFCSGGDCVEVERTDLGHVRVSDTHNGEELVFTADEWAAFVLGAKAGEFDLDRL